MIAASVSGQPFTHRSGDSAAFYYRAMFVAVFEQNVDQRLAAQNEVAARFVGPSCVVPAAPSHQNGDGETAGADRAATGVISLPQSPQRCRRNLS